MRTQVDARYNYALSQVFGASLLKRINDNAHEQSVRELVLSSGLYPKRKKWDFVEALNLTYQYLRNNYRCEYVYKNEIANQILLKYHSDNSAALLRELVSDRSIADVVIVNGNTTAYEIKTELDNFERLEGQLESYLALYDYSYVVTHPSAAELVRSRIPDTTGIIVLDENVDLQTIQAAKLTDRYFSPLKAVNTLRQAELVAAYKKYVGDLPRMGTALVWNFCRDWFVSLDIDDAHAVFAESLKSRRPHSQQFDLIRTCDNSLKMLFLSRDLPKRFCSSVMGRFGIFD